MDSRGPYLCLHAQGASQGFSAAQTPEGFQAGGEISSPGAGGASGCTAGGCSPLSSCTCSLNRRKHYDKSNGKRALQCCCQLKKLSIKAHFMNKAKPEFDKSMFFLLTIHRIPEHRLPVPLNDPVPGNLWESVAARVQDGENQTNMSSDGQCMFPGSTAHPLATTHSLPSCWEAHVAHQHCTSTWHSPRVFRRVLRHFSAFQLRNMNIFSDLRS